MAIALSQRRVVLTKLEIARGTAETPLVADAIPLLRQAEFTVEPIRVDRPTIRLSLTDYPDIYPGKSRGTTVIAVEVHGRDSGFPASAAHWLRLFSACGMRIYSEVDNLFAYKISGVNTDLGPLRHNEAVTGTAIGGTGNQAFGDSFSHDGGLLTTIFINEGATPGGGSGTLVGSTSGTSFNASSRSTQKCLGWAPQSDVNAILSSVTIVLEADGKAVKMKGCAGDVEFQFNHGDAVLAEFTMSGIIESGGYIDLPLQTTAYEGHKVPPTFLGSRLSLSTPINTPAGSSRYGTGGVDTTFVTKGALSQVRLSTGNDVLIQDNALDADGAQFYYIPDRNPVGSFNPTEVTEAEFSFMSRFIAGTAARMHILVGGTNHTDPSTQDQNTFEWLTPGVVFTGLADAERDKINIFDGSFDLTGGDYDSTAFGEAIGQDNEFVIIHR